jgi:hypothetical protein
MREKVEAAWETRAKALNAKYAMLNARYAKESNSKIFDAASVS